MIDIILKDLEEILSGTSGINKVSQGKPVPVNVEDVFTAIYIVPPVELFEPTKQGVGLSAYDSKLMVKLIVNINCENSGNDLEWVNIRTDIINAVLNDVEIWNSLVDRDVISVVGDDYDNYPKKTIEIAFEFISRAKCNI